MLAVLPVAQVFGFGVGPTALCVLFKLWIVNFVERYTSFNEILAQSCMTHIITRELKLLDATLSARLSACNSVTH